jgi:hypothetical protein
MVIASSTFFLSGGNGRAASPINLTYFIAFIHEHVITAKSTGNSVSILINITK